MNKLKVFFAIAMLTALSVSISGCKEDTNDEDQLPVRIKPTESNLCDQVAEVVCHNAFQCCQGKQLETLFGITISTTEKDCRRDVALSCEQSKAEEIYSLSLKRVEIDTDRVEKCLNYLIAPDDQCFPVVPFDSSTYDLCDNNYFFIGQVKEGEECLYQHDCVDGTICDQNRECTKLPVKDESCENYPCAEGLYCDTDFTDTDYPVNCKKLIGEGKACNSYNPCEKGLFCKADEVDTADTDYDTNPYQEQMTGTCTILGKIDASCEGDNECESYECIPGICSDQSGACYTNDDCSGTCSISGDKCNKETPCSQTCNGGQSYLASYDTDYNTVYEVVPKTGDTCYGDYDCEGTCALDKTTSCANDLDCPDPSYCTDTDGTTMTQYTCDPIETYYTCEYYYGTGSICITSTNSCENAGTCEDQKCGDQAKCQGKPKCKEAYYPQNYCESTHSIIDIDTDINSMM
ncbi:MAG: hypothetical protein JXR91_14920 [Deltaproteobacteria bacterium]|nr:hypothetical protein [Deltaproteobacteria bacterium]